MLFEKAVLHGNRGLRIPGSSGKAGFCRTDRPALLPLPPCRADVLYRCRDSDAIPERNSLRLLPDRRPASRFVASDSYRRRANRELRSGWLRMGESASCSAWTGEDARPQGNFQHRMRIDAEAEVGWRVQYFKLWRDSLLV